MYAEHIQKVLDFGTKVSSLDAEEIIRESIAYFGPGNISLASSLSPEDQVLTHMIMSESVKAGIFTLDTGRLPQETYDVMQETVERYKFNYEVLFPDAALVEKLVSEYGPNLFYNSVELRKRCCEVRKVIPLKRKLSGLKAWMCGLRREQSVTRVQIKPVEWDFANGLAKINPLVDWSQEKVWEFIKKNNVPYNKLNDRNFPSIGCQPCTREVKPGEDLRAGRWWWEPAEHKECGLHKPENNKEG